VTYQVSKFSKHTCNEIWINENFFLIYTSGTINDKMKKVKVKCYISVYRKRKYCKEIKLFYIRN